MIEEVGGVTIKPKHRAMCHCGSVELELELAHGIVHRQLTKKLSRPPKAGRLERRVRDIFICQFGVEPNQGGCWPY